MTLIERTHCLEEYSRWLRRGMNHEAACHLIAARRDLDIDTVRRLISLMYPEPQPEFTT